jgi:hypothetical protein
METTYGLTGPFSYGRGFPQLLDLAVPAVGAVASHRVPGEFYERLVVARAGLVTHSQEGVRTPTLQITDADDVVIAEFGPSGEVAKESEQTSTWAAGLGFRNAAVKGAAQVSIPDLILSPGMKVILAVGGIKAAIPPEGEKAEVPGDQQSRPLVYVERWPTGPDGYPSRVGVEVPSVLLD